VFTREFYALANLKHILELIQVLIIGAGTSGLCAGYELKRAGFDVQIFEASSRVAAVSRPTGIHSSLLVSTGRVARCESLKIIF